MHRPCTPERIRSRLRRMARTGVDRVMVAVVEGRVVGFAGVTYAWLFHADVPTARLMSIAVDESCRGQGVGRRLVEASVDQARACQGFFIPQKHQQGFSGKGLKCFLHWYWLAAELAWRS